MNQRFYVYPILFIALMQLMALARGDRRWYLAQIAQLIVILLACFGAIAFSFDPIYRGYDLIWVAAAAVLFLVFVIMPPLLAAAAAGREQRGQWRGATAFWRLAGAFTWGQTARLYRWHGVALVLMARGHQEQALAALDELASVSRRSPRRTRDPGSVRGTLDPYRAALRRQACPDLPRFRYRGSSIGETGAHQPQPMPLAVAGLAHVWKLSLLVTLRHWERALAYYESVYDWGTLGLATQARLLAARAQAETGQFERALRGLQFVALSPRTVGARQAQLWATRVSVAALAGDRESVEELLSQSEYTRPHRRFARFAAYWRGRCALARGEFQLAVQMLTRAFGLTHPRNRLWREAIQEQLRRAEQPPPPTADPESLRGRESISDFGARNPMYARGQELLRRAEEDSAPWRALMHMGRPERATLSLLVVLAAAHLVSHVLLREEMQEKLLMWAGNSADTVKMGEWGRLFTASFLHANLLHLGMNAVALWLFGSAVEKALGRWRMVLVFLVGGALGNLLSASVAHYELAIGASGGLFAVIGAFGVGVWRLRSPMYFSLRRRLLLVLVVMVAADFAIGGLEPQVDNLAHVGGLVAGAMLALVLGARRKGKGGMDNEHG